MIDVGRNGSPDADTQESRTRASYARLPILTWVASGLIIAVPVGISLAIIASGRIPVLTEAAFEAAADSWDANGPQNYDMDILIEGNRAGFVHVEVRNGETVLMRRDGKVPDQKRTWHIWSVEGQFDTVERELEMVTSEAERNSQDSRRWLRCEFDPKFGFVRRFHRAVSGGGTEIYWEVTNFEPR